MSQSNQVSIQPSVSEHYKQLCAAYGTAPTKAQIEQIKGVVGVHRTTSIAKHFEYALLYFLPRSTVVFREDTLLLGWHHQPDGSKQEIWYKLSEKGVVNHLSQLSLQCGAPRGADYKGDRTKPICDEWHPSLTAICTSSIADDRYLHCAYFASTVRVIKASHPLPSIEDITKSRPRLSITLRKSMPGGVHGQSLATNPAPEVSVLQEQNTVDTGLAQDFISNRYGTLCKSDDTAADSIPRSRLQSRDAIDSEHSHPSSHETSQGRNHERPRQLVVVDLTESGSEDEIKSEPNVSLAPLIHEEDDIPPEQEMRNMLQNKKVSELQDILAKREGQIPDWIEEIARQEMKKKMARDVAAVRNFF
jgi:hypothetical protein